MRRGIHDGKRHEVDLDTSTIESNVAVGRGVVDIVDLHLTPNESLLPYGHIMINMS